MSSSIPIPPRANKNRSASATLPVDVNTSIHFGKSLPCRPNTLLSSSTSSNSTVNRPKFNSSSSSTNSTEHTCNNSNNRHSNGNASTTVRSRSNGHGHRRRHQFSQDDMAVPSIELISKAARRWKSGTIAAAASPSSSPPSGSNSTSSTSICTTGATTSNGSMSTDVPRSTNSNTHTFLAALRDADYSEVVTATDQVRTAFQEGAAITKRPPRSGVSGTYFFCHGDGDGNTIGVFKPMDEEAQSIDISASPPLSARSSSFIPISLPNLALESLDISAGATAPGPGAAASFFRPSSPPAAAVARFASSDKSSPLFSRGGSASSDSDTNGNGIGCNSARKNTESTVTLGRENANGFFPGEGAYREVAAYILDHKRFAGVPQTALLRWDKPCNFIENEEQGEGNVNNHGFQIPNEFDDDDNDDHEFDDEVIVHEDKIDPRFLNDEDGDDDDSVEDGEFGATVSEDYLSISDNQSRTDYDSDELNSNGDIGSNNEDEEDDGESDYSYEDDFEGTTTRNGRNFQTKRGAFQVYVQNIGDADDFGPGVFDKDQVHRIAILDIRTINHDRHGGNILVRKAASNTNSLCWSSSTFSSSSWSGCSSSSAHNTTSYSDDEQRKRKYDLVPIDHGYILPDRIQNVPWPVWMDWPMIKEPVSDDVKEYVQYLDAERDVRKLKEELKDAFRPGALQSLKIAATLLQKGIAAGLTLYEIGLLMYTRREDPHERSELEKIVYEAEEASLARDRHIAEQLLKEEASMGHVLGIGSTNGDGTRLGSPTAAGGTNNEENNSSTYQARRLKKHHRHLSSNAIFGNTGNNGWGVGGERKVFDEYVVKYASKMIQEVVNRVAAAKLKPPKPERIMRKRNNNANIDPFGIAHYSARTESGEALGNENGFMNEKIQHGRHFSASACSYGGSSTKGGPGSDSRNRRPSYLTRVRSIPDFGIGEKPIQVILNQRSSVDTNSSRANASANNHLHHQQAPTPTPASSPLACRSPLTATERCGGGVSDVMPLTMGAARGNDVKMEFVMGNGTPKPSSTLTLPGTSNVNKNNVNGGGVGIGNRRANGHSHSVGSNIVTGRSRSIVSAPIQIPINDERVKRIDLSLIGRKSGPISAATALTTSGMARTTNEHQDAMTRDKQNQCDERKANGRGTLGSLDDKSSPVSPVERFKWNNAPC